MKKFVTIALLLALLCAAPGARPALAEGTVVPGTALCVVECEEYVTLRTRPDASSQEIDRVPLGEIVVFLAHANDKFDLVGYDGNTGYVRNRYLAPALTEIYHFSKNPDDYSVIEVHGYEGDGEQATFTICDKDGQPIWTYESKASYASQFDLISGFIAVSEQTEPMFLVNNAETGLTALDLKTGAEKWTLPKEEARLGGGNSWAVDKNGVIYIGGYDGPDPVAISPEGKVLWRSNCEDDDMFWLYQLEVTDKGLVATYESTESQVVFSLKDGSQIK